MDKVEQFYEYILDAFAHAVQQRQISEDQADLLRDYARQVKEKFE